MTIFHVTLEVADPQGAIWEPVQALADTGATFTKIPRNVLQRLGIVSTATSEAVIADGRRIQRQLGEARLRIDGQQVPDIVTFGEPGEEPLLGSHTLEAARLAVDPVNQRLISVPIFEMRA